MSRRKTQTEDETIAEDNGWRPHVSGDPAPIVILCDPPTVDAYDKGMPISPKSRKFFGEIMVEHGFTKGDVVWVSLCPPMPEEIKKSASKQWKHVEPCVPGVIETIKALNPLVVVPLGSEAARVCAGRAVKITKVRGIASNSIFGVPMFPMYSPNFVLRIPDNEPAFRADINSLMRLKQADFDTSNIEQLPTNYSWVFDFDEIADQIQTVLAVDTETTGLTWHNPDVRVLTIQLSPRPGVSWVFPVDREYCERWFPDFSESDRVKLVARIGEVLEDGSIRKMGHNIKYDHTMLRKMDINVQGWLHDTQLLAFNIDENMLRKDLDECVRIWVPAMSGYADEFNRHVDKSRMIDVPPEDILNEDGSIATYGMLKYAGGDTDAVFRLAKVLDVELRKDPRQRNIYRRIQMPAIMVFANSVERFGMCIDRTKLNELEAEIEIYLKNTYKELIRAVPAAVRAKHLKAGLSFSRSTFVRDTLFSQDGFKLRPIMFTESTRDLKDESQKVPSTSKDHLVYFVKENRQHVANFCTKLISYQQAEKMISTYVGNEEEETGFHQYIAPDGRIYPSYMLHRTNTGRTASSNPNGQNIPKRGMWAEKYQRIFYASPGYQLVNCDLSQIELRLVAWMANEPTMRRIYAEGGDIHTATAKAVLGLSEAQWEAMDAKARKLARFRAKAVNFGLIYGMSAGGFQIYAKTDYDLDLTLREAEQTRETFFNLYRKLPDWHMNMKEFAHKHGYVRSLHGAVRHLPSIRSNDPGIRSQAERQAINAPIQRMGSDLGLISMIRFTSQMDPEYFRLIGFVHDALVLECKEGYAEEGAAYLKWVMQSNPLKAWFGCESPIPILADAEISTDGYASGLVERPDIQAIKPSFWDDDEEAAIRDFMAANPWLTHNHVHVPEAA